MQRPGQTIGVPVICIGNPTLGGAGKTPAALAIGQTLVAAGRKPFFLSRGYGGHERGPRLVDPAVDDASAVGDEPLLLSQVAPTVVARDRVAGAKAARDRGADVIVMDDGFQNPALNKSLSILVVDGRRGIGNGCVFPAGPLRAPLEPQLGRADALLILGDGEGSHGVREAALQRQLPVFDGRLVADPRALADMQSRPVLAFAGIGDPEKFFRTLTDAGIEIRSRRPFADHHSYRAADANALIKEAAHDGLMLVTTEKDWVRLKGEPELDALARLTTPLPVALRLDQEAALRKLVLAAAI